MKKIENCSLVISTYNWPEALNLCLQSIMQQSIMPAEIIIADDGSTDDTRQLLASFVEKISVPIIHVWQEDEGFRLAQIRNKAIATCKHEYVIQIDGDLILHRDFIKDHLHIRRENHFVTGGRVLLSSLTTKILTDLNSIDVKKHAKKNKNFLNGLRIPFLQKLVSTKYKSSRKNKYYVKGCNMAFWKKDLLIVNGYNEAFVGWGREDSELAIRLINSGTRKLFLKFGGIAFHLYHKEASRSSESHNVRLMKETEKKGITNAELGLYQYIKREVEISSPSLNEDFLQHN